jgi:hypothetical protein
MKALFSKKKRESAQTEFVDYNVVTSAILFFFLEKLSIIKITFHKIDFKTTWELPTDRVIPGTESKIVQSHCHTWESVRKR